MTEHDVAAQNLPDLARAIQNRRRRSWRQAVCELALLGGFALATYPIGNVLHVKAAYLLFAALSWPIQARFQARSAAADKALAQTVAAVHDAADTCLLLECLRVLQPGKDRDVVLGQIGDLAPLMTDSDVAALKPAHYEAIMTALVIPWKGPAILPRSRCPVHVALLNLLARAEHAQALDAVADIARFALDREVKEAAQACTLRLQAVRDAALQSATLLRPSDEPTAATLLRPAQSVPEEQLLRPANGDET